MAKILPGNIDEVRAASQDKLEIILLRKDFSKESFFRINLEGSTISKCIFVETKFFANEYINCDFISCDFTKADFLNVNFKNCKFHECKFDEAILQEVNFEESSIISCSFSNVKIEKDVSGLDEKDLKIIHEEITLNSDDMLQIGFQQDDEETFSIRQTIENGPKVELIIVKDSEMGNDIWRVMFMVDDESLLSDTFDTKEAADFGTIEELAKSILLLGGRKVTLDFFNDDPEKFDLYKKAYAEVKNKFKQN
jgi:hypothetical protein